MTTPENLGIRPPYFAKTVLTFLAPLILSIMVLGFLSVKNTQSYVVENVHRVNSNVLRQTRETIDSMIDELNIITLNFSINTKAQYALRRILQKELLEFEDIKELEIIQNMLSISHYSRSYIQSIYTYFDNPENRFITSETFITSRETFPDTGWFESYRNAPRDKNDWWEIRTIRKTALSTAKIPVLTFYKKIYNSTMGGYNGVVVFNVYSDFIRDSLNSLETFDNQTIVILDQSNTPVVKNNDIHDFLIPGIFDLPPTEQEVSRDGRTYTIAQAQSKYNLKFISIVPNDTLYRLPDYLFKLNLLYILLSLLIGVGSSLYFARNSNRQIRTIIEIIRSARQGRLSPPEKYTKVIKNSYQYILYNILNTFIEKDYLAVQLSEKMFKSRVDELTALQSQINPHFLFNTLQTINMKALSRGRNDVSNMIEHLSLILRYSLSDPSDIVPLSEEISHAKSYVAIQTIRYRNRILIRWDYDEALSGYGTIKLLLQPLIENSIYHGIREREHPGEIHVAVAEDSGNIVITIADSGVGIEPEKLAEIRKKLVKSNEQFEHIGLYNTNRRIKLTFGDAYGMTIDSEKNTGTRVVITLPKLPV